MTEFDPPAPSLEEQLRQRATELFVENPNLVVEGPDKHTGDQLHFVIEIPGRTAPDTSAESGTVEVPASYKPYVLEATNIGFTLCEDQAALNNAVLPGEAPISRQSSETLWMGDGSTAVPHASVRTTWDKRNWLGESVDKGAQTIELDENNAFDAAALDTWLNIINAAQPYDPREQAILRAPAAPNGLRAAADQLALLAEVERHKQSLRLSQMGVLRRLLTRCIGPS